MADTNRGRFTVRGRAHGYEGNPGGARMEGRPLPEDEPGLTAYTSSCGTGRGEQAGEVKEAARSTWACHDGLESRVDDWHASRHERPPTSMREGMRSGQL